MLPVSAIAELGMRDLGCYVHVPFCRARCGYCDFNTYIPDRLGAGADPQAWQVAVGQEVALARRVLGASCPPAATVFFGGGTPSLLAPAQLIRVLEQLADYPGIAPDAEITLEANPETLGAAELKELCRAGFNRISLGMQSAVPRILAVLDRGHRPERVPRVVGWAREAGFAQVSLDLIYGAPGETLMDWRVSLNAAIQAQPDHISAYALVIEPGTALGRRLTRGEIAPVDEDQQADSYLVAEDLLTAAGYRNYEISNWSCGVGSRARHNLAYWLGANWWGFGPGAHSHVGGVRWWNLRHPARYAACLGAGHSPAQAREVLGAEPRRVERVLLELRLADGLPLGVLTASERDRLADPMGRGLIEVSTERVRLTLAGRLLADTVVRDLLD